MKLFLLKAISPFADDWDTAQGFVIRAETEDQARQLAIQNSGDEQPCEPGWGAHILTEGWALSSNASCEELTSNGEQEIILRDFNAG